MSAADRFIDTNVVLYLLSADPGLADVAEKTLMDGGVISVQVLNEFAAVASRKLRMPMHEIREVLAAVRAQCTVVPVTEKTHELALTLAEKYRVAIYDAVLLASAIIAGCRIFLSQDLQHGQEFEDQVTVRNPFA